MTQHKATITRLDIAGFKSFADDVHLDILPGLTGIVGPNGCGKSNIVEALRWTMGESSARALRGGESDDLIFAGTGARSSRNFAKVTLSLENAESLAPAPFDKSDELNISRQTERGRGSTYRINGQTMRARDVQTLFADLSSGARSSSIISQNRVSQLIAAKPEERRSLLEEAAGITGLYARRRDAELKLRQSESNLERAEDRRLQLEEQLSTLQEQSSHARHYRTLSEKIRETELQLLTLQHERAKKTIQSHTKTLSQTKAKLSEAEEHVVSIEQLHTEHEKAEAAHQETLETLRPLIDDLRVHIKVAQKSLEHSDKTQKENAERLQQIESDLERQKKTREQLSSRKETLLKDLEALQHNQESLPEQQEILEKKLEKLLEEKNTHQQTLNSLTATYHKESLQQETLKSRLQDRQEQYARAKETLHDIEEERAALQKDYEALPSLGQALNDADTARSHAQSAYHDQQKTLQKHYDQSTNAQLASQSFKQAEDNAKRLEERLQTLTSHLSTLTERLSSDKEHSQKLQATLLSSEQKQSLEDAISAAQKAAHEAYEQEKDALKDKEKAENDWLTIRAQHEKRQQQHRSLTEEQERLAQALSQNEKSHLTAEKALEELNANKPSTDQSEDAQKACATLQQKLDAQSKSLSSAQKELASSEKREEKARRDVMEYETALSQCHGECEGLRQSLGANDTHTPDPVIDHIRVPEELTRALACALTDGLDASLSAPSDRSTDNQYALSHWVDLAPSKEGSVAPSPTLQPLAAYIEAPKSLTRALSAIFLVRDAQQGAKLHTKLAPGQSLVSREGHVWRWDGFVRSDKAPSAEAVRLEQQQRLHVRSQEEHTLNAALEKARATFTHSQRTLAENRHKVTQHSKDEQALKDELGRQNLHRQELERQSSFFQERLHLAQTHLKEQSNSLNALKERLHTNKKSLEALPDDQQDTLATAEKTARQAQEKARQTHDAYQRHHEALNKAERAYEQAQLQHQSTQERLKELHTSCERLTREVAQQQDEQHTLTQEFKSLDLQALRHGVSEKNEALMHVKTELEQTQKRYEEAQKNAERLSQHHAQLERSATTLQNRLDSLQHRHTEHKKTLAALDEELAQLSEENASLPDISTTQQSLTAAQRAFDSLQEDIQTLKNKQAHLKQEEHNCHTQRDVLQQQHATLEETWAHMCDEEKALTHRQEELRSEPEKDKKGQDELRKTIVEHSERLHTLEKDMTTAREKLQAIQTEKAHSSSQHHHEEAQKSHYREEIVRIRERLENAQNAYDTLCQEAPLPENPPTVTETTSQAEQKLRRHVKNYSQERDALGPVNLCAEDEFQKAHDESEHLLKEHTDLTSAIARLRGGIGAINREGRVKLTTVFTDINTHFQSLFERMFGGGRAHLALIGSDDPLEAGLEIFAQPPGKKLSTLSLLSGGEQALTALSLIFAAFHCTPAPLCVLDEVDAPLDDANTERFCHLLSDMTRQTSTRFLVVTHHQLTMAHMDRLFGVTMQERGVSQLLSVNLDESIKMANG